MERGYLGVSFFFMLSGFILTYNYPSITSKRDYLAARAARILPVYYLSLLFALPWLITYILSDGFNLKLWLKIILVLTLTQSWVPTISGFWNGPAWTLSCEAFFYTSLLFILKPLTHWCAHHLIRSFSLFMGCMALGLAAPILFYEKHHDVSISGVMLTGDQAMINLKYLIERFPLLRWLEFVAGVVLCLGVRSYLRQWSKFAPLLLLTGLTWVLSSLLFPFIFSMGTYCLPGFALMIAGAAALPFPNFKVAGPFTSAFASFGLLLGNASYAVYLFHFSVIGYVLLLNRRLEGSILPGAGEAKVWALFVATALITTILSILVYLFYEEASRKLVRQYFVRPR